MLQLSEECRNKIRQDWANEATVCRQVLEEIVRQHPHLSRKLKSQCTDEVARLRGVTNSPKGFISAVEYTVGYWF